MILLNVFLYCGVMLAAAKAAIEAEGHLAEPLHDELDLNDICGRPDDRSTARVRFSRDMQASSSSSDVVRKRSRAEVIEEVRSHIKRPKNKTVAAALVGAISACDTLSPHIPLNAPFPKITAETRLLASSPKYVSNIDADTLQERWPLLPYVKAAVVSKTNAEHESFRKFCMYMLNTGGKRNRRSSVTTWTSAGEILGISSYNAKCYMERLAACCLYIDRMKRLELDVWAERQVIHRIVQEID